MSIPNACALEDWLCRASELLSPEGSKRQRNFTMRGLSISTKAIRLGCSTVRSGMSVRQAGILFFFVICMTTTKVGVSMVGASDRVFLVAEVAKEVSEETPPLVWSHETECYSPEHCGWAKNVTVRAADPNASLVAVTVEDGFYDEEFHTAQRVSRTRMPANGLAFEILHYLRAASFLRIFHHLMFAKEVWETAGSLPPLQASQNSQALSKSICSRQKNSQLMESTRFGCTIGSLHVFSALHFPKRVCRVCLKMR